MQAPPRPGPPRHWPGRRRPRAGRRGRRRGQRLHIRDISHRLQPIARGAAHRLLGVPLFQVSYIVCVVIMAFPRRKGPGNDVPPSMGIATKRRVASSPSLPQMYFSYYHLRCTYVEYSTPPSVIPSSGTWRQGTFLYPLLPPPDQTRLSGSTVEGRRGDNRKSGFVFPPTTSEGADSTIVSFFSKLN